MEKKGVVIMTTINLQQQPELNYAQFILNSQRMKSIRNYHRMLQSRLRSFNDLISNFYQRLFTFADKYLKEVSPEDMRQYESNILKEIVNEYEFEWKNGVKMLHHLSHDLDGKSINEQTCDLLLSIITHQEEITKEILNEPLTIERIEIVFNHLREVPFYLKSDLEINQLPNRKQTRKILTKKESKRKWKVIADKYNSNSDENIYETGA